MRWIAHGMVLNEEAFCRSSILSIYNFVDEIVLVEGSTQYAYSANAYGLSSDRTAEIIRSIPDPGHKIRFYQVGWVSTKRELRSMSLKMCTYKPDTCLLVLDLDEVWDPHDLQRADEAFSQDPKLQYLHCELIQLRGDFEHYRDMSTGEQEHALYNEQAQKQPIHTRTGVTLRQGRTAERLFRWSYGMYYVSHTCICDVHGRYPYIDPGYLEGREWRPDIKFWHYNYLKPFPQVFLKFCYFAQQDGGTKRNDPQMIERALGEGYVKYLLTGEKTPGDWAVTNLPDTLHHPEIMRAHSLYGLSQQTISDPHREWDPRTVTPERMLRLAEQESRWVGPDLRHLVAS